MSEVLRPLLHRDKTFLKELYESDSIVKSKRIINFATDSELNTLWKYLHYLSNGEIKIKKEHFEKVKETHIRFLKKNFEPKKSVQNLNQMPRKNKLQKFYKLTKNFTHILAPLFKQ